MYLDASHSEWLGVGEAAYRVHQAGAIDGELKVRGFFLNVSNYRETEHLTEFGTWVSACITAASAGADWARGHFDWCPSQYNPDAGYAVDYSEEYAATVTAGLENMLAGAEPTAHFVIDTGRNGQGPLDSSRYAEAPCDQPPSVISELDGGSWCNARGAGLGLRPTLDTGVPLLDAYRWIKVPGESDGTCNAAGGARAWDYSLYNPWDVTEEEQPNFDPCGNGSIRSQANGSASRRSSSRPTPSLRSSEHPPVCACVGSGGGELYRSGQQRDLSGAAGHAHTQHERPRTLSGVSESQFQGGHEVH